MKNKAIIFSMIIFLLLGCFLVSSKNLAGAKVDDQHILDKDKNQCSADETEFCTHLPLVLIDTHNQDIPGEARDGTMIVSDVSIIDNDEGGNHLDDKPSLETSTRLRYRGNSSMNFDKKGYLLKFIDEKGNENEQKVMGMKSHDEWVLHGPFLDKTLIKNYMWYSVSRKIMGSAPNTRFCEVYVDGKYQGLYLMVEAATRGDKSRMQVSKYKEGDDYSSYIVRFDRPSDEDINNFTRYTLLNSSGMKVIYPGATKLNDEVREYIKDDINRFEKSLYSFDYDSNKFGYRKYINVDSFVDYYIINEFSQNIDAGRNSTYIYKDAKGKLNMYVWDFNNANDGYIYNSLNIEDFNFQYHAWYEMFFKDEYFTNKVIWRYENLREHWLNEEYLLKFIDETIEYLGDAIDRNFEVWGYVLKPENGLLEPSSRNPSSYEEAVEQLKKHIINRGRFLDEYLVTIKQFSAESKVKQYNH